MKNRLPMIKPLAFACSVALAACSSGGGDSVAPATTTVTGTAEAPNGVIAQFEQNKSLLVAAVEYAFPAAIAGITGLQPVTGATVELIRIDDDGNQVGDVLATTSTSITGDYSLALPSGVSLAGNLVVRITGNSGASMSAMVVDQAVDINPISQFVLDKFVDDDDLVLADLAINEVVALSGKVEEFDLTATADLSTMLAQLEAEVGQFVDNEIAIIESTPDDGTAVAVAAGKWHTVEMGFGLHDTDNTDFGTFALDALSEEITFSGSGNTDPNLTIGIGPTIVDAFTNFMTDGSGNTSIYHESDIGAGGDSFPANIDADGNISLSFDFEEELQTVDTQVDLDGPDFGWRYPPGSEILRPVMGGNIYVTVFDDAGVRYETTDTNNDGVKDAIDPTKRAGDEVSFDLSLFLKEGNGMTVASVDGDYGVVIMNVELDNTGTPTGLFDSTVGLLNFDGSGDAARDTNAFNVRSIERTPATPPAVNLASSQIDEPGSPDVITYTVADNGQMVLSPPGGGTIDGFASSDGGLLAFVDDEASGAPVDFVNNEMIVAVKLATGGVANTTIAGATYKLYSLGLNTDDDGSSEVFSIGNGLVTFSADAAKATITGVNRGVERSSDVAQVEAVSPDAINETFTVGTLSPKGKVTMSLNSVDASVTQTTELEGYVSADTNMIVLRLYSDILFDDGVNPSSQEYDLGMVIGVKQ